MIGKSFITNDDNLSFERFKFENSLEQNHYLECPKCGFIHVGLDLMESAIFCSNCGDDSTPILFPPEYRLSLIYGNIIRSYYRHFIKNSDKEHQVNQYLSKKYQNITEEKIHIIIEHVKQAGNHFVIAKEIEEFCKSDMKEALYEAAVVINIMSKSGIESTFIIIQTMTLFEMWLSLLIRRILVNKGTDEQIINYILNGLRSIDRYLSFIKECGSIPKEEILNPIFSEISHSELEKIRNDIVHRGILETRIEIVQKAVKAASRFLSTIVDVFNRYLVKR